MRKTTDGGYPHGTGERRRGDDVLGSVVGLDQQGFDGSAVEGANSVRSRAASVRRAGMFSVAPAVIA
jgi:hypothetical protein